MPDHTELLSNMYQAFNERKADVVLPLLHPDVQWPNGWEGGTVSGRDAVGEYWARQWSAINPTVVPEAFQTLPDGRMRVSVHQRVLDHSGNLLLDQMVGHTYAFLDGLIVSMEIDNNP